MKTGWVIVIIIGIIVVGTMTSNRSATTSTSSSSSSSRFLEMTPAMKTDVAAAIRSRGYNCPLAKMAHAEGEDAYGTATQVWCGPADRDGVYEKATFRVTFRPNGGVLVAPWE